MGERIVDMYYKDVKMTSDGIMEHFNLSKEQFNDTMIAASCDIFPITHPLIKIKRAIDMCYCEYDDVKFTKDEPIVYKYKHVEWVSNDDFASKLDISKIAINDIVNASYVTLPDIYDLYECISPDLFKQVIYKIANILNHDKSGVKVSFASLISMALGEMEVANEIKLVKEK